MSQNLPAKVTCPRCGSTEFHLEDKPTTIIGKCNNCLRMIFWHSKTVGSTKFFIEEGEVP